LPAALLPAPQVPQPTDVFGVKRDAAVIAHDVGEVEAILVELGDFCAHDLVGQHVIVAIIAGNRPAFLIDAKPTPKEVLMRPGEWMIL
jgi:hypothetical protein